MAKPRSSIKLDIYNAVLVPIGACPQVLRELLQLPVGLNWAVYGLLASAPSEARMDSEYDE